MCIRDRVSLMKDQVGALVQAGVAAAFLNNSLNDNQKALMLRLSLIHILLSCAVLFSFQIIAVDHFSQQVDGVRLSLAEFLVVSVESRPLHALPSRPSRPLHISRTKNRSCLLYTSGCCSETPPPHRPAPVPPPDPSSD